MKAKKETIITLAIVFVLIVGAVVFFNFSSTSENTTNPINIDSELKPAELLDPSKDLTKFNAFRSVPEDEIQIDSDGTKFTLDPDKIRGGGPPKGGIGVDRGIPALDESNIKYTTVEEADTWIEDNELVLALIHNGVERVYPLQILVFHEIANDVVGGDPIAVTYCPLCGSGIAYFRVIDGQAIKIGTSGKLYNSNLVMYDDLTDTYWQQIDGNAIVGELAGFEFKDLNIDTVVWREWKAEHPNSEVLSKDTGMRRSYGNDPYGSYYEDSFLFFPVDAEDNRVHPKTVIFGIEIDGKFKAYKEDDLIEKPEISDTFNGVDLTLTRDKSGIIKIIREDTNEEIIKERDFWFAWYAFHTETELYNG